MEATHTPTGIAVRRTSSIDSSGLLENVSDDPKEIVLSGEETAGTIGSATPSKDDHHTENRYAKAPHLIGFLVLF